MAEKDLVEKKLEDELIESFQSDFWVVARFFKNRRLGRTALTDDTELAYPAEIAEMLAVFAQDERYRDVVPAIKAAKQKGERVTMCWMAQEVFEKGEKQGQKQGEKRLATLLQRLTTDGRSGDVQNAINNEQERNELYCEYGLAE